MNKIHKIKTLSNKFLFQSGCEESKICSLILTPLTLYLNLYDQKPLNSKKRLKVFEGIEQERDCKFLEFKTTNQLLIESNKF